MVYCFSCVLVFTGCESNDACNYEQAKIFFLKKKKKTGYNAVFQFHLLSCFFVPVLCLAVCAGMSSQYILASVCSFNQCLKTCILLSSSFSTVGCCSCCISLYCALCVCASLFWGGLMSLLVKCVMDLSCAANCL